MRLLLDEHLSWHLCRLLKQDYPGCAHVIDFNLQKANDQTIWHFAKTEGFTIVSKDSDFHQNSFLYGHPPKVIWLRVGNRSTSEIAALLRSRVSDIAAFEADPEASLLVLS